MTRPGAVSPDGVVQRVQAFADRWCDDQGNRLVVTSRIEGYWAETLRGFEHVDASRLQAPDEVQEFLLRVTRRTNERTTRSWQTKRRDAAWN